MNMILILAVFIFFVHAHAGKLHHVTFRWPDLYPEGLTYDRSAQHFIVGSLHQRTIHSVSDAGVIETLISDQSLPPNASFLGLRVDSVRNRLFAAVHSTDPLPTFNALACYDLRSRSRLFLAVLPSGGGEEASRDVANDVAVDHAGNTYVTNSANNFIWKVTADGVPSIFSRSPSYTAYPVNCDGPAKTSGLNGVVYISKGYLLVVQSNTGKLFKVDADDGTARTVLMSEDLIAADGIAVRNDGVLVVVSQHRVWFVKSDDSWSQGAVFDETALDAEGFATSVVVGEEERVYVLYGNVLEGIMGNATREKFRIEEVRSEKESKDENVWVFVLVGFGFAYFLFWRFQMKRLLENMNKKTN